MRIALVVPGGVDRSAEYRVIPALLALISRLSAHHDVQVFALQQEAEPAQWPLLGAQIHNIGAGHMRLRAIRAVLAEHRRIPFELIHAIWASGPGMVAVIAARMSRLPSLVHVAGGEIAAVGEINYGGGLSWKGRLREAVVLRAATCVTAASRPMTEALGRIGIEAQRVPLGVDVSAWPLRAPQARVPGSRARLVHVANLNKVKDQTTLLHALHVLRGMGVDFHMDVVGEDVLGGQVQQLAARLGLEQAITFHGFLTQSALRPVLERSDLMIISSRHEAGPVVLLEAALVGVPTVGTAVGHIAEWAPWAARSVPVADATSLAHAVAALLADEEARLVIAREAQRRAASEDADYTLRSFEAIYARLTARANETLIFR